MPDMHFSIDHVVSDPGNNKVVTIHTCTGTDTGMGIMSRAPTGKSVSITGILVHEMRDGKICKLWTMFDLWAGMTQVGHVKEFE